MNPMVMAVREVPPPPQSTPPSRGLAPVRLGSSGPSARRCSRGPVTLGRHGGDQLGAGQRLPALAQDPCCRVHGAELGWAPCWVHFANRSKVYIRAAFHSADPVRGIDGDLL